MASPPARAAAEREQLANDGIGYAPGHLLGPSTVGIVGYPIRFERDLRVTIQALGWKPDRFVARQDDIASVAFWYQTLPTAPLPRLPPREALEID